MTAARAQCMPFREGGEENTDDLRSVHCRQALYLAEFMLLHFWLRETDAGAFGSHSATRFADRIVENQENALKGLDAGEGGIEYAALVMADAAAADWLEKDWPEAEAKIAAARSLRPHALQRPRDPSRRPAGRPAMAASRAGVATGRETEDETGGRPMTLTARFEVGEDIAVRAPFPGPPGRRSRGRPAFAGLEVLFGCPIARRASFPTSPLGL